MSEQTHHESDEAVIRKLEAESATLRERVAELEGVLQALLAPINGEDFGYLEIHARDERVTKAREALAASKKGYDHYNAAPRSLADGPHDHDHLEGK